LFEINYMIGYMGLVWIFLFKKDIDLR